MLTLNSCLQIFGIFTLQIIYRPNITNIMQVVNEKGYPLSQPENKKLVAGILGIISFTGALGVHKFILGYTREGILQIILTFVTCGIGGLIPFIEGIIYLTKTDEEFYQTYQVNKRGWF